MSYASNYDKRDAEKIGGINNCEFFAAAKSQASTVEEARTLNRKVVSSNLGHGKYFFPIFFSILHQIKAYMMYLFDYKHLEWRCIFLFKNLRAQKLLQNGMLILKIN